MKTVETQQDKLEYIYDNKLSGNITIINDENYYDLSVVIPAKNEQYRIKKTILNLKMILDKLSITSEIIVIDDGSSDQTLSIAKDLGVKFTKNSTNNGIAGAFRKGAKYSRGKTVMLCPADIEDFTFLEKALAASELFDVVSVSKRHKDSIVIGYSQWRWFLSNSYQKIVNLLFGNLDVCNDTHYIKFFNGMILRRLIRLCRINGPVGETELILHARDAGCSFSEVPAKIIHEGNNSKTSILLLFRVLIELFNLFIIRKSWEKYEDLYCIDSTTIS